MIIALDRKHTSFFFCVLFVLFSLLTITGVSFGSSDEDDESEEVEPVLNLRETLQVKPLNIPVLEGEVSIELLNG
jgi:hypothetical protein